MCRSELQSRFVVVSSERQVYLWMVLLTDLVVIVLRMIALRIP